MTTGTAGAIVQKAYEDAGLCAMGQTVTAGQLARGIERLNDIINLWATQGLKLWLQQPVNVPLVAGQGTYSLGPAGDVVMTKPLSILQGTYITSGNVRQPLVVMSRDEYTRLSQIVGVNGAINSYFTNKEVTQLLVSFWNTPSVQTTTGYCEVLCRLSAPNVAVSADSAGFPPEWTIGLRWALADEICVGQPDNVQARCAQRAGAYREALEGFDVEDAPTFFQPDSRNQYQTASFR
jgi:hypothetical protein